MPFPFRIGTTSFIYPAGWLENVEKLSGRVSDVELLCFEASSLIDPEEHEGLLKVKNRERLSYTVHTPLDIGLASADEIRRQDGVRDVQRVIQHVRRLDPYAYIVHVCQGEERRSRRLDDLEAWQSRAKRSLTELLELGIPPETLCVESMDYDFSSIESVVQSLGISVAIDIGHLRESRLPIAQTLERNREHLRVIHWHGSHPQGGDHRSLKYVSQEEIDWLLNTLCAWTYRGVLTLEVFSERDFEESLEVLTRTVM
jgi:sugar phosphate isomerase/epimerase